MLLAHSPNLQHWLTLEAASPRGGEFCEFMAGEAPTAFADPAFKARLRRELWDMLRDPSRATPPRSEQPRR